MEMVKYAFIFILIGVTSAQDASYWNDQARQSIQNALALQTLNTNQAKNVIFFLADGMSIATVTAARIRQGQLRSQTGEENSLGWEDFPHVGLIKTYNTDAQTPDSAGTATAFFTGVKTKAGIVGVDDSATRGSCSSTAGNEVDSILTQAYTNNGMATGLISTARLTHATPAATYAHSADRDWENDNDVPSSENACKDIALQLIEDNPYIRVMLGGGRRNFYPSTEVDPEDSYDKGHRKDGRNLISEWQLGKTNAQYVWNKADFDLVDPTSTDYLFGLFEDSHMQFDVNADYYDDPSLSSMTEKAIRILEKDPNGYLLVIEAGRIDHAHHYGEAFNALGDAIALSDAVEVAKSLTSSSDTLIVVTSDHSHTMTIGGYPARGNPILGLTGDMGTDNLPYTTLSYANGPGGYNVQTSYESTGKRPNHTNADTEYKYFEQDGTIPLYSETHGGEDVAVYAYGPMSHLFHGVHEQNYIAHAVRYAGCLDPAESNVCNTPQGMYMDIYSGANVFESNFVVMVMAAILSVLLRSV